jgi:hypothetical protein
MSERRATTTTCERLALPSVVSITRDRSRGPVGREGERLAGPRSIVSSGNFRVFENDGPSGVCGRAQRALPRTLVAPNEYVRKRVPADSTARAQPSTLCA